MLHLFISCSSYLLFFFARALMPTQQSAWRTQQARAEQLPSDRR